MARELSFPTANVTLNDLYLLTGDMQFEWPEIVHAEVVTRRYPVDWRTFARVYAFLFLFVAVIWAVTTTFGWVNIAGPLLAVLYLIITIYAARDEVKRSYRHTLTIDTTSGSIDAATLENDAYLLDACESINKRVKRYAATPTPRRVPQPSEAGEPTRLMQAK